MAENTEEMSYHDLMLKLPLFSCIIKEIIWLKRVTTSKSFLKKTIEDPELMKDYSVLKTMRLDEESAKLKENVQLRKKAHTHLDRQLKLYDDLQWSRIPGYFWPVHSGDYSPLSPDGDFVDRHGKLGLDFWQWNRETSPLGYIPPLCTCKRTEECIINLKKWSKNMRLDFEHRVCENDVCRGMLYIPYSLLEIPLNRAISNGSEFALKVNVPNETDVYCGNMKHTIILCTTSRSHEKRCLQAIELSEVSTPLIYDVESEDFIPFFKKYNDSTTESPLMTVEPIDSDVPESEHSYGLGQMFAIRRYKSNIMFEKYDPTTKETSSIDDILDETWDKMMNSAKSEDSQDLSNEEPTVDISVNIEDSEEGMKQRKIKQEEPVGGEKVRVKGERTSLRLAKLNVSSDNGKHSIEKNDTRQEKRSTMNTGVSDGRTRLRTDRMNSRGYEYAKGRSRYDSRGVTHVPNDMIDDFSDYSDEMSVSDIDETPEEIEENLKKEDYKLYRLIESFSSDRRPQSLTLRSGTNREDSRRRTKHIITLKDLSKPKKKIKVTPKEMQSLHLLSTISKF